MSLSRGCAPFSTETGCCQGQHRLAREQVKTARLAAAASSPTLSSPSLPLSSVHLPLRAVGGPFIGQEQVGLAVCRPPPGLLVGHRSRPFPQPSSTRRGQHWTSPSPFISPWASLHRSRQRLSVSHSLTHSAPTRAHTLSLSHSLRAPASHRSRSLPAKRQTQK